MGIESLLERLSARPVTDVTSMSDQTLPLEPAQTLAVTPVTAVTSGNQTAEDKIAGSVQDSAPPALPPVPDATTKQPPKHRLSCQAFEITGVAYATMTEHCLDVQGPYCEGCELKAEPRTEVVAHAPVPCLTCRRLEVIEIIRDLVPG